MFSNLLSCALTFALMSQPCGTAAWGEAVAAALTDAGSSAQQVREGRRPTDIDQDLVRVTLDEADDYHPRWAPDGRSILFTSQRGGRIGIWLIGWPPGEPLPVETGKTGDHYISWSPDGTRIAFDAQTESGAPAIWLIPVGEGDATQVEAAGSPSFQPSWSPDGQRLAFASIRSGNVDIWAIELAGGRAVQLTSSEATDHHPVWSADGGEIFFVSDRGGDFGIWRIAAAGGEPALVFDGLDRDDHPAPSPDGKWLAFSGVESGERTLRLLSLETGRTLNLISGPVVAWPSWSPDGSRIAFVAGTESNMDIWVVRLPPLPLPQAHPSTPPESENSR